MFRNFLGAQPERRSRSKSPGGRQLQDDRYSTTDDEGSYRKGSRRYAGQYPEDEYEPDTPRFEERTPDAYESRPSKDDRRRIRRDDEYESSRKPSKRYEPTVEEARPSRGRRERNTDQDYNDPPKSPRPNGYANGDPVQYAAFSGNGSIPGGFPGQSVKPPPAPAPVAPRPKSGQYQSVGGVQYAQIEPTDVQYKYNTGGRQPSYSKQYDTVTAQPARTSKPSVSAPRAEPGKLSSKSPRESEDAIKSIAEAGRRQSYHRERSRSPAPGSTGVNSEQLRKSLGRLSTGGAATLGVGTTPVTAGGKPPASPLMEAYRGTYQTISPLPSPLSSPHRKADDDLSDFDLSEEESDDEITKKINALKREKQKLQLKAPSDSPNFTSPRTSGTGLELVPAGKNSRASSMVSAMSSGTKGSKKKAVSFYDPDVDAEKIAEGLKGNHRTADLRPLCKILPWLTTDEIIHLKTAYKNFAKINGQGINLSKHIKARTVGNGNLGKILYATSLGQYESDAYWANCFYQSGASRRELLIESLVGRSNQQIREIKDVFKDKKYDDDLEKCIRAELKADKFRDAILIALAERRMPEGLGIDMRLVHEDGEDLHDALAHGSETAMLKIVMLRSDDHLREVLRYYEASYRRNFARDMISRSQNLAGETMAHLLNGALNRPMRDSILIHQSIEEFAPHAPAPKTPGGAAPKPAAARAELLISRVVRLHWEPKHLEKVKRSYENRYGERIERAMARNVLGGFKTEDGKAWATFCIDLVRSSDPA